MNIHHQVSVVFQRHLRRAMQKQKDNVSNVTAENKSPRLNLRRVMQKQKKFPLLKFCKVMQKQKLQVKRYHHDFLLRIETR